MRRALAIPLTLALSACQQSVKVPTTDELLADPKLLSEWQAKCDNGDYSHLPADQKDAQCFTTREAARSAAIKRQYGI